MELESTGSAINPTKPQVTDEGCDEEEEEPAAESQEEEEEVSVELAAVPPLFGVLKKGPYMVTNASPKMTKTLKKQKWATQFCRIDPALFQIFCCDKDKGKTIFCTFDIILAGT